MHIISDASLKRPGYVYERDGTVEGFIGYPAETDFNVVWKHVDGPLLKTSSPVCKGRGDVLVETEDCGPLSECPSCKQMFENGGQCAAPVMRGGCPMGGDV